MGKNYKFVAIMGCKLLVSVKKVGSALLLWVKCKV